VTPLHGTLKCPTPPYRELRGGKDKVKHSTLKKILPKTLDREIEMCYNYKNNINATMRRSKLPNLWQRKDGWCKS
jgi:hypothetical protein